MGAAVEALVAGTLQGASVLEGKVWSDEDLRSKFGMGDEGVMLYKQARSAIDASLDEVAAAEAFQAVQFVIPKKMREAVLDEPRSAQKILESAVEKRIAMEKFRREQARESKKHGFIQCPSGADRGNRTGGQDHARHLR